MRFLVTLDEPDEPDWVAAAFEKRRHELALHALRVISGTPVNFRRATPRRGFTPESLRELDQTWPVRWFSAPTAGAINPA
ncbi:MAG: hypothetical protein ACTHU0_27120 [Kofleriaceae bacterium]